MAYRVKYTTSRPFSWEGRDYAHGDEFCDPDITDYSLDMMVRRGNLTHTREVIHSRAPGAKAQQKKSAAKQAA